MTKNILFPECEQCMNPETFEPSVCILDAKVPVTFFMNSVLFERDEFFQILNQEFGQAVRDYVFNHAVVTLLNFKPE